ncbi:MAG: PD-(D/E)XK nuclease family protein [Gammaproteobacteria bacterium]|nr:PD-(D/E)XK nuclease family protein [Gammaproteobacteria bacterium]
MRLDELLKKDKRNIIICPQSYNEGFFKEAKDGFLFDLSFISPSEFINNVLGFYREDAIVYLNTNEFKGFKRTIDGAKSIINSIPFLEDESYKDELSLFYEINPSYIEYLKDKNILYLDKSLIEPLFQLALKKLSDLKIESHSFSFSPNKNSKIYLIECANIIEEVENTIDLISTMLINKKDINKIKIFISDSSYYSLFMDVLSFYDIPYSFDKRPSLFELSDSIEFYNYAKELVKNDENYKITSETIKEYNKTHEMSLDIYNSILRFLSNSEYSSLDYLKNYLEKTKIKKEKYKDSLYITSSFDEYMEPDTTLFMLGINQGIYPKTIKLKGLYNDDRLKKLNLNTIKELNIVNEEYIISKIKSLNEVYISYPLKNLNKELSISSFISKIKEVETIDTTDLSHTSKSRDYFKYLKAIDTYYLYKNKSADLDKYHFLEKEFKDILLYDSDIKIKDFELFKKQINSKLKLSYSSLDNYFYCPTKYYYNDILKLSPYEATYNTFLGSFFHKFIEEFLGKEYDEVETEELYKKFKNEYIEKYKFTLSVKDELHFKIFYSLLKNILEKLNEYRSTSTFKIFDKEHDFLIPIKDDRLNVILKGQIDLVLKDDNNNIAVIDYKTGTAPTVDFENSHHLQLFIYMKAMMDKGFEPFGMFYMEIPQTQKELDDVSLNSSKSKLQFKGYKIEDTKLINEFLGETSSKVFSKIQKPAIKTKEEFESLGEEVSKKIEKAKDDILSLSFKQKPSKEACQYCEYNEICYKYQVSLDDDSNKEEGNDSGN